MRAYFSIKYDDLLRFAESMTYIFVVITDMPLRKVKLGRALTRAIIGGGVCVCANSYIRVLPDGFILKTMTYSIIINLFQKKSVGRTRVYKYAHPPNYRSSSGFFSKRI